MNEMTEAGEKAKGGKGKGKAAKEGGEVSVEGEIARMLVRAVWAQEWAVANPEGKPDDRKNAWKDQRTAAMEKNVKTFRRALASLKRSGVEMTLTLTPPAPGEEDAAGEQA